MCGSNLLRWAVRNSRARWGTPWLWCGCNEGFRCRSSPASRPSPSPRSCRGKTNSNVNLYLSGSDPYYAKKQTLSLMKPWPDAVLVGYSDAGVEGVELHNRWNSGVSVDEYLIIQTGNACNRGEWCRKWAEIIRNSIKIVKKSCSIPAEVPHSVTNPRTFSTPLI